MRSSEADRDGRDAAPFAVQAVFTSWPAHLFLTLALLIYAIDVLAPPLRTLVRRLPTAAGNADRDSRA